MAITDTEVIVTVIVPIKSCNITREEFKELRLKIPKLNTTPMIAMIDVIKIARLVILNEDLNAIHRRIGKHKNAKGYSELI